MVCISAMPASCRLAVRRRRAGEPVRCSAAYARRTAAAASAGVVFQSVLLAVVDSNPYLTQDTRGAVEQACKMVGAGKLHILLADSEPLAGDGNAVRLDTLRFHLAENGFNGEPNILSETGQNRAAALSDAAETVSADLLVLSCGAVHSKAVDMALLCEFLDTPLLLVP